MGTDVLLVMPWRPTPDRMSAFALAEQQWASTLGLAPLLVDTDRERFNLAAARNAGVRQAEALGAEVVIVADADTFGDAPSIVEAVKAARTSGKVHTPYREYRSFGQGGMAQLALGKAPHLCDGFTVPGACSGIFVTTPAAWWSVGGMDERFTVWAPEDWAFRLAHEAILGDMPRHAGVAYAMHHRDQPGKAQGPEYEACVVLYQRYVAAAGDPAAMRELVGLDA